jgi:hypothetical protein
LACAAAAAGARGQSPFELLAGAVREVMEHEPSAPKRLQAERALAALARLTAAEAKTDADAVAAQSEQAIRHASDLANRREAAVKRRRT